MKILSDLHNHTVLCDGEGTAREMVEAATARSFLSIGISGHAYTPIDPDSYYMSPAGTQEYLREVRALKEEYCGRIDVLLGTEFDLYSKADLSEYDYVIGSVHYVRRGGNYFPVDASRDLMEKFIRNDFGGDGIGFAERYFSAYAELAAIPEVTVVGHLDLLTKYNGVSRFFDESDPRYFDAACGAIRALADAGKIFEINTGGMGRAARPVPYPAPPLLGAIRAAGGRITINSDSHSPSSLGYAFDIAADEARACGFTHALVLTSGGWQENPL